MRKLVRENGLSLFFGVLFLGAIGAQAVAGHADYNNNQLASGMDNVGFGHYLTSSQFAVDVAENWQSEFLQFLLYVWATVWFIQRGSPESKAVGEYGRGTDREQGVGRYATHRSPKWARVGGWRTAVYSHSLGALMAFLFLFSWLVQAVAGRVAYNEDRLLDQHAPLSWGDYLTGADFWNRTLQNWQSEFLAVGSFAVLAVYLRHRGSPESKPVGAAHDTTGVEG